MSFVTSITRHAGIHKISENTVGPPARCVAAWTQWLIPPENSGVLKMLTTPVVAVIAIPALMMTLETRLWMAIRMRT